MPVKDATAPRAEKSWPKIYVGLLGFVVGLSLLKFGNPVILDYKLEPPKNFLEIAIQSWPVAWGYWLVAAVSVLGLSLARWKATKPPWLLWLPLAWLMWQFVCATNTVSAELTEATLKHFLVCVICFYLGFFVLSETKHFSLFLGVMMICFALVLWMGLDQHFGGLERLRQFVREEGHAEQLAPGFLKKLESNRIFSTLVYPNAFAGVIILLFPPIVAWLTNLTGRLPNIVRGVVVGFFAYVCLACLYWTGSKSGWLIAMIIAVIALSYAKLARSSKLLIITVLLVTGLVGFSLRHAGYFERGASSVTARFDYWRAAVKIAMENPVWGTGPGTFSVPYKRVKDPSSEMARLAHNDYLEQLSDSGIIGFALFCAAILSLFANLYRKRRSLSTMGLCVWLGLVGWAMQSVVEFGLYIPAIAWTAFVLLGWLVGVTLNEIDKHRTVCEA